MENVGPSKIVGKIGTMGIYNVHASEPFKGPSIKDSDFKALWRRVGDRVGQLDSMLVNRATLCHIIPDDRSSRINMAGYDYVCRRIDSGEAFGSELKDLRLVKEIADTLLDLERCRDAVDAGDRKAVIRILSKYPTLKSETRRSKARKNAVEVA